VVPHGSFGERGFARAIEVAARGVRLDVAGRTHERLAAAGALRNVSETAASLPGRSERSERLHEAGGRISSSERGPDAPRS
jgi:hypothetical protein